MLGIQTFFLILLAPLDIVLGLDNTDGVIEPGLHHVAHRDHGVLLQVILQYAIIITTTTTRSDPPKIITRPSMLAALSPLIVWGNFAPEVAQLPRSLSNVSVESRLEEDLKPPVTMRNLPSSDQ